jgi:hypothetical protein
LSVTWQPRSVSCQVLLIVWSLPICSKLIIQTQNRTVMVYPNRLLYVLTLNHTSSHCNQNKECVNFLTITNYYQQELPLLKN